MEFLRIFIGFEGILASIAFCVEVFINQAQRSMLPHEIVVGKYFKKSETLYEK